MKVEKSILIVLGMHRSGTSVATRLFNLLGANPGKNLMLPAEDNPTGFWEPADIAAVHDELLQELGFSWDDPRPLPAKWWLRPNLKQYSDRLRELADQHYSYIKQPILKDPRLCRLLPVWRNIFKELGWQQKYILVGRSPLDVANSLAKRNNITANHGYMLWLRHIIESEKWSRGSPRSFLLYDQLLDNWETEIKRCRLELDLKNLRLSAARKVQINDFIDLNLRHSQSTEASLDTTPELTLFIADTFHAFQRAASRDRVDKDLKKQFDSISQRLQAADKLFSTIWQPYLEQRDIATSNVIDITKQNEVIQTELEHFRSLAHVQKNQLNELLSRFESLSTEAGQNLALSTELDRRREEHVISKAELERQLDEKSAHTETLKNEILALREQCARKEAEAITTKNITEETQSRIKDLSEGLCNAIEIEKNELTTLTNKFELQIQDKTARIDSLQNEVLAIGKSLARKEAEEAATKDTAVKAQALLEARNQELLEKIESRNTKYTKRIEEHERAINLKTDQIDTLQKELIKTMECLARSETETEAAAEKLSQLESLNRDLNVSINIEKNEKSTLLNKLEQRIDEKETRIDSQQTEIISLREQLARKEAEKAAEVATATEKLSQLEDRHRELIDTIEALKIKENALAGKLEQHLDEKATRIETLQRHISEISELLTKSEAEAISNRDLALEYQSRLETLTHELRDKLEAEYNQKTSLESELETARETINRYLAALNTREEEARLGRKHIQHLESTILEHKQRIDDLENTVRRLKSSVSWLITSPLRITKAAVTSIAHFLLSPFIYLGRWSYHKLPVEQSNKQTLKSFAFRYFPVLFSRTIAYRSWRSWQDSAAANTDALSSTYKNSVLDTSVSVVIPVYDNWDYTEKCLDSIRNHNPECQLEIIVVDDCSTDETAERIKDFPEVRYIKNDINSGFIESCNNGARNATGDYLFFLNNDTTVTHGWLDELVLTYINFPQAGLVGSKLIYPDGRLQEAGGIIWKDGSAWNYGRYDDPGRPEYNYTREVDYISGAAIMVPKALFDELGGFDKQYKPAYCEDSDLALKIRSRGMSVLYQPLSVIIHYEGISSGTDLNSGVKSYQVENSKKLFDRWRFMLSTHRDNGVEPYLERDRKSDLRILVIDASTPEPDKDAGSITAFHFMKSMVKDGHRVTFIPADNFAHLDNYTYDLQRIGVECIYGLYFRSVKEYLEPYGKHFDVVFLYRVSFASRYIDLVRSLCPDARIVFDTVDLHYLREQRQAEIEDSASLRKQANKTKETELEVIRQSDATIVLSDAEKQILAHEIPDDDIHVIPLILEIPGRKKEFRERNGIIFIGGFRHTPNVDAVHYFITDIWPLIRKNRPDMEFTVIGSHPPDELLNIDCEGVNIVGFVEDISGYFDNALLSVVPLRYGAGIKGKVGTSLSYGVPVVGTTVAIEGMGLTNGKHVLVADEAEDFANKVLKLSKDEKLWLSLSDAGISFVDDEYSVDAGHLKLQSLLTDLRHAVNE